MQFAHTPLHGCLMLLPTLLLLGFIAGTDDGIVLLHGVGQRTVAVDAGVATARGGDFQIGVAWYATDDDVRLSVLVFLPLRAEGLVNHLPRVVVRHDAAVAVLLVAVGEDVDELDGLLSRLTHLFLAEINK